MKALNKIYLTKVTLVYKYALFFVCLSVLLWHLKESSFSSHSINLTKNGLFTFSIVLLVLALCVLNWSLEFYKWKILLSRVGEYSNKRVFHSLIHGISASFITPARTGDVFARAIPLNSEDRSKSVLAMFIASFSQLFATIIFGLLSLFILKDLIYHYLCHGLNMKLIVLFSVTLLFVPFVIYFIRKSGFSSLSRAIKFLSNYSQKQLLQVFSLSFARYFVFTIQFLLMLMVFDVNLPFFTGFGLISIIYLVTFLIPGTFFGELGLRETAAVLILSPFAENNYAILIGSLSIWLINLAIPAIVSGAIISFHRKDRENETTT
jgi:hypothetical protein